MVKLEVELLELRHVASASNVLVAESQLDRDQTRYDYLLNRYSHPLVCSYFGLILNLV